MPYWFAAGTLAALVACRFACRSNRLRPFGGDLGPL